MNVIEFAERRMSDPGNTPGEARYWAAYLDGARAQKKETIKAACSVYLEDAVRDGLLPPEAKGGEV